MSAVRGVLAGAAAGAAGTTALNAVTYLDMAVRARPASSTPQDTVDAIATKIGVTVPGDEDERRNRVAVLGPLTGLATGVGVGAALGVLRTAGWHPRALVSGALATVAALVGSNGPMTALGVSDPRTWVAKDWVADVIPHIAYGAVTAAVLHGLGVR